MPLIHKEVSPLGDWIIYMNGVPLYKKWPTGRSVLFDKYGPSISNSDRDAMPHAGTPFTPPETAAVDPFQNREPDALTKMIVSLLSGRSSDAAFIERTVHLFVIASDALNWKDFESLSVFTLPALRDHFSLLTLIDCNDASQYPTMPVEIRSPIRKYLASIPGFRPEMGHKQSLIAADWHAASEIELTSLLGSLCEDDEQDVLREPLSVADAVYPDGGASWISYLLNDAASNIADEGITMQSRSDVIPATDQKSNASVHAQTEKSDMNPFQQGDDDTLARMIAPLLAEYTSDEALVARATNLFVVTNEVLHWKETEGFLDFDLAEFRDHLNLKTVIDLTDAVIYPTMPATVRAAIKGYLETLPQYRPEMGHKQSQTTLDEHGMAEMQLTKLLGSIYDTYQHLRPEGLDVLNRDTALDGPFWIRDRLQQRAAAIADEDIPDDIMEIAAQLDYMRSGPSSVDIARLIFNERKRWQAENERLRKAADYIEPYLRWTISDESPGHHPTMQSAVAAFNASFDIDTPEKRIARVKASTKITSRES